MESVNRILLIDNDDQELRFLKETLVLNSDYSVHCEPNLEKGFRAFEHDGFSFVIAKFNMPEQQNVWFVKELKKIDPDCIIVALVDEDMNANMFNEISRLGVYDIISKPINLEKLFFLIKKGVDLHALALANRKLTISLREHNDFLQKQNSFLARRIEESTKNLTRLYEDLRQTYMHTIKVLAQAIDAKDHYTHSHSQNVAKYAVAIAEEMGFSAKDIDVLRDACELHDLGKIGVDDSVLSKPSSLTPEEWEQIKRHPQTAAQILEPLTFLNGAIDIIRQHHEHYNGSGYPEGRKGNDILIGARIIHVADAYEAMCSARSYRKIPFTKQEAIAEIKKHTGTQFDPGVVEAFLKIVDKL